jgi:hypothetical protein
MVCNMPLYKFNRSLAMGTAISRTDISPEDLDVALDAVFCLFDLPLADADVDTDAATIYRTLNILAELDSDRVSRVGVAWQYPESSPKSMLEILRYHNQFDKYRRAKALVVSRLALWNKDKPRLQLTAEQWQAFMREFKVIATNLSSMTEAQFVDVVRLFMRVTDPADRRKFSVKDILKMVDAVLTAVKDVDFSHLYIADLVVTEGFTLAVGDQLNALRDWICSLERERLIDIAMLLPDRYNVVYSFVRYAVVEQGLAIDQLVSLYDTLRAYGLMPIELPMAALAREVSALAAFPAQPTETQWQQIRVHVDTIFDIFNAFLLPSSKQ